MDNSQDKDVRHTAKAVDAGQTAMSDIAGGAQAALDAGQDAVEGAAQDATQAADQGAEALRAGAEQIGSRAQDAADGAAAAMSAGVDYSRNLAQGFQTVAAEWMDASRTLAERTVARMTAIAQARNVVDLMGAQRELLMGGVQDMLDVQQRVGAASLNAMTTAAQGAARAPAPLAA